MIIGYLTHDTDSFLACFLTCCSWYIVAVPHLHTLITPATREKVKNWWPDCFRDMHKLGLFPLVKRLQVQTPCGYGYGSTSFSPELLDPDILHQSTIECPVTRDRGPGNPWFHAKHSTLDCFNTWKTSSSCTICLDPRGG